MASTSKSAFHTLQNKFVSHILIVIVVNISLMCCLFEMLSHISPQGRQYIRLNISVWRVLYSFVGFT